MKMEMENPELVGQVYPVGTIIIPYRQKVFNGQKSFIRAADTNDGPNILYIHPDLVERFSQMENKQWRHEISYGAPEKEDTIREHIRSIGKVTRVRVSLAALHYVIALQPRGEHGALLTNGHANIFCITSLDEGMQCIIVRWWHQGWRITPADNSHDNARVTSKGRLFFLKP